MHVDAIRHESERSASRLFFAVLLGALGLSLTVARADDSAHAVAPVARGNFPHRVHVFEDYETEIEKRWWLRGEVVTMGVSESLSSVPNRRACRAVETLNFDRKMGDRVNKVKGVVFNPVPGPPMGKNTRLSFRYRLAGSDTIKVQIYSLSKNYHRFLLLTGLPQGKWQSATVDMTKARRPDGSGGPLAADERIDDIQFYVSRDADLLIDDIVLFDAADRGERRPFPARAIFTGWFDTGKQGKEWPGDFDIVPHKQPRTWDAARSIRNKVTGKPWLRVGLRGRRLLSSRTSVAFQYRLSKPSHVRVALVDTKNGRQESAYLDSPETGAWSRTRLDFLAASNSDKRFADEFRFYVESPEAELQIDDLLIYEPGNPRGSAVALPQRPKSFPHRIWAACDFEAQTTDFAWFGPTQTDDVPRYPGNKTAMGVAARPYKNFAGIMTGINPVPGPRMGQVNSLFLRYRLTGATAATFQHFSLSVNDNNHIRLSGLTQGRWGEVTMNFSRDGRRNDGTAGVPFSNGERMDDLKVFVGKPKDGKSYDLLIDDVIFFANDPTQRPEREPFPNRVIFLAAFDTGISATARGKYWLGDFQIATKNGPQGSYWGVAQAVKRNGDKGKWIRLQIRPVRQVGAHTKLRFRYYLTGASAMTVQIFDATDQDNRHVRLTGCKQNQWVTQYLDFTTDAKRNDGSNTPFAAGHVVDDLFFFVKPEGGEHVSLFIDEVVLFDAAIQ